MVSSCVRSKPNVTELLSTQEERQPALWDPGNWEKSRVPDTLPSKVSKTARGGGVIKLPGKVEGRGESHKPIGVVKKETVRISAVLGTLLEFGKIFIRMAWVTEPHFLTGPKFLTGLSG